MSVSQQVRDLIYELDRPFTIHDLSPIWEGMDEDARNKAYSTIGTVLIRMKNHHREIIEIGKGEKSPVNGKRAAIYQQCEPSQMIKETFNDKLYGWRNACPELFISLPAVNGKGNWLVKHKMV